MRNDSIQDSVFGYILGKATEPDHTQTLRTGKRRKAGWEDDGGGEGRRGLKGGSPVLEIRTVAMVTRHNRQQRRRGYVTFRGPAGAEGEGSSAWHPHKGLNFHKTEGQSVKGGDGDGCVGGWVERERVVEIIQEEEQRRYREKQKRGHRAWVEGEEGCDEGERKLRRKSKEGRSTVIGRRQIT